MAPPTGRRNRGVTRVSSGYAVGMRIGDWDVRPLGGATGCLLMIVVSVLLSVLATLVLNLVF